MIRIGRRPDNNLVLDDPHISRIHAMLQAVDGQYVVKDLGSTAGTRVNHHLVKEAVLRPGDVITLAAVELIYGEDRSGPPEDTPPYAPEPSIRRDVNLDTPLDLKVYKEKTTVPQKGDTFGKE